MRRLHRHHRIAAWLLVVAWLTNLVATPLSALAQVAPTAFLGEVCTMAGVQPAPAQADDPVGGGHDARAGHCVLCSGSPWSAALPPAPARRAVPPDTFRVPRLVADAPPRAARTLVLDGAPRAPPATA